MPVWREKIRNDVTELRISPVGILQEQHPRRALLFDQWKQLQIPLWADPLNRLDVKAVPIIFLVDRYGIIRYRNPSERDYQSFLEAEYSAEPSLTAPKPVGDTWFRSADELTRLGQLDVAIAAYRALEFGGLPNAKGLSARRDFRLGVVYRMRYDRSQTEGIELAHHKAHQADDFRKAAEFWRRALDQDPNQYIWRRRIQQYGPILDKPYPFYGWVEQARTEIRERGEIPVEIGVEPTGAELTKPSRSRSEPSRKSDTADREAAVRAAAQARRITADGPLSARPAVNIQAFLVRSTDSKHRAARFHATFQLAPSSDCQWNNEADPLTVMLEPAGVGEPEGSWTAGSYQLTTRLPTSANSTETRHVETEVYWPEGLAANRISITAHALYHLCDKTDGTCMLRRQTFDVTWERDEPSLTK